MDLADGELYLFTDGVTEAALDTAGRTLGDDGFRRLVTEHAVRRKEERLERIVAQIESSPGTRTDDVTVMVIEPVAVVRSAASGVRAADVNPSPA